MRLKPNTPLWEYLEASGVLEQGTDEEIKAVKRRYRKEYLLKFKRAQRSNKREYTLSFQKDGKELTELIKSARVHKLTVTAFIRKSCFAYLQQTYLVPNPQQVAELELLLSECLNEIKAIAQKRDRFFWDAEMKLERIEKKIEKMEQTVHIAFRHPPKLS